MTNETDTELLELAAKAAGFFLQIAPVSQTLHITTPDGNLQGEWNPLTDDGDALRLAVKLKIGCEIHSGRAWAWSETIQGVLEELLGSNPYAATRRAIVRAAAEIGRAMK